MCQLCSGCSSQARMICKSGRCLGHTSAAQKPSHKKGNADRPGSPDVLQKGCRLCTVHSKQVPETVDMDFRQQQKSWIILSQYKQSTFFISPPDCLKASLATAAYFKKNKNLQTNRASGAGTNHITFLCILFCFVSWSREPVKEISFPSVWKMDVSNWINICNSTFKWPWLSCWNEMNQYRKGAGKEIFSSILLSLTDRQVHVICLGLSGFTYLSHS